MIEVGVVTGQGSRTMERDWQTFRELREPALQRFCQRVLDRVSAMASDPAKTAHERYLAIFKYLRRRDDELADAFNNPRRSDMLRQIVVMRMLELLEPEEMERFTPEVRESVQWRIDMFSQ
jgi:hypothetical protein